MYKYMLLIPSVATFSIWVWSMNRSEKRAIESRAALKRKMLKEKALLMIERDRKKVNRK